MLNRDRESNKKNMSEKKIKDWPENERPRERLVKYGAEGLSDAQLLAIILRTGNSNKGVMNLAIGLLDSFKGLGNLNSASIKDLSSVKGLGTAKIAQLKAAFELGKRLMGESRSDAPLFY